MHIERQNLPRKTRTARDAFASLVATILLWRARLRERRQLAALDARALEDIGVAPREALREARKPFWRP